MLTFLLKYDNFGESSIISKSDQHLDGDIVVLHITHLAKKLKNASQDAKLNLSIVASVLVKYIVEGQS
jgi:hypothetical protein